MTYPVLKDKYKFKSIVNPKEYTSKNPRPYISPETIILTYYHNNRNLTDFISKILKIKMKKFGNLYRINDKLGIYFISIGAPSACAEMEDLIALGVKEVINIGIAGSLSSKLKAGDIVLCEKSIRDEGVSYHYLKPQKYSYPSKKLNRRIEFILSRNRIDFTIGPSWTTDAPYRETKEELIKYRDEGVLTVEMESAGIYAVSEYRKISSSSIFVISDVLTENGWHQYFKHNDVLNSLKTLFKTIIMELLEDP
jgi:purine-nucleoside phosphorylase